MRIDQEYDILVIVLVAGLLLAAVTAACRLLFGPFGVVG
jgi:hypothetical protein